MYNNADREHIPVKPERKDQPVCNDLLTPDLYPLID